MKVTLCVVLVVGLMALTRVAVWPLVRVDLPSAEPRPTGSALGRLRPRLEPRGADSVTRVLVARNPFRIMRRAALVAYDPMKVGQPEAPTPPKPTLALVGLVAGTDASALVEGFPGIEGARVVRVGDVVAGLVVKRIAGGEVRIAGMDTVWVLRVRSPW